MSDEPVVATVHVEAPPERVYEFFTRPEAIVTWMGEYAYLDPTVDGRFEVDIKGAPMRGRFLYLDPPHRLVIGWGYAGSELLPPGASTVDVRLTPDGVGTRVDLHHYDLPHAQHPGHATGWHHYFTRLQVTAAGGNPGPDLGMPSPYSACVAVTGRLSVPAFRTSR